MDSKTSIFDSDSEDYEEKFREFTAEIIRHLEEDHDIEIQDFEREFLDVINLWMIADFDPEWCAKWIANRPHRSVFSITKN